MHITSLLAHTQSFLKNHYKRTLLWGGGGIAVLLVLAALLFYFAGLVVTPTTERSDQVVEFIHDFGDAVALVNVSSTTEEHAAVMETAYAPYLDPSILDEWKANPALAFAGVPPGAQPVALRVKSVQNTGILSYVVKVFVQTQTHITIPGLGIGVAKGEFPFTFGIGWRGFGWKIIEFTPGHAES